MNLNYDPKKSISGFTISLVLVVITTLGVLALVLSRQQAEQLLCSKIEHHFLQASFNNQTAKNEILYRIHSESNGFAWRTFFKEVNLPYSGSSYQISLTQNGIHAKYSTIGKYQIGTHSYRDSSYGYLSEFHYSDSFPTIILRDTSATIQLAGESFIYGNVSMLKGFITPSTRNGVLHIGKRVHEGRLILGKDFLKKGWNPILSETQRWGLLMDDSIQFAKPLTSTFIKSCENRIILSPDPLVILDGSRLNTCQIFAPKIKISGKNDMRNMLIYAHLLDLSGSGDWQGQFIARDSMILNKLDSMSERSDFVVLGNDTNTLPTLIVDHFKGNANFWQFDSTNSDHARISSFFSKDVSVHGIIWSEGLINFNGKLQGTISAWNFAFQDLTTLWVGYLKDGQITQPKPNDYIHGPLGWMTSKQPYFVEHKIEIQ